MTRRRGAGGLALAVLLAAGGLRAGAQSRVLAVEFDPKTYFVGQEATAVVFFDAAGLELKPARRSDFPEPGPGQPRILSAELGERRGRPAIIVRFAAWLPGPAELPPISVGGVDIPSVKVEAASALAAFGRDPPRPQPQREPPGLRRRLYLAGGVFLLVAAAAFAVAFIGLPWFRRLLALWAFSRVRSDFNGRLAFIRERGGDGPEAWALLCRALRRYLSARSGRNFEALCAGEVAALPEATLAAPILPEASALLLAGDYLRFGGRGGGELRTALELAGELADRLDEAYAPKPRKRAGGPDA